MLFWGSSTIDLRITIILLILSFVVGLVTYLISRKLFLGFVVFSVLGNISFLLNIGSEMFDYYNIMWIKYFSFIIWPVINIVLIYLYYFIKSKK